MGAAVEQDDNGYEIVPPQKIQSSGGYEIAPPEKPALTPAQQKAKDSGYVEQSSPTRAAIGAMTPDLNTVKDFGSDLWNTGKSIIHTVADPPKSASDKAAMVVGGPMGVPIKRAVGGYFDSVQASKAAADDAAAKHQTGRQVIETAATALPLVGPLLHGTYGASAGTGASRVLQAASMAPEGSVIPNPAKIVGGKVIDIAKAEGDPGAVYNKYLKPVEHVPMEMPKSTPHIERALINKVEINYPEVAERMRQGSTTLGDLDIARQVANDASKAAYTARGLPTQISKGFKDEADSLRETIYPKIEALHNLPEGELAGLKKIQGQAISAEKPPKIGYFPSRWPVVAAKRLGIMPAESAIRNVRTRVIDAGLPEPQKIDLRSSFPSPEANRGSILKARSEAERPEFGGDQPITTKPKPRAVRPAIDVEEDTEPALLRFVKSDKKATRR